MNYIYLHFFNIQYWYCVIISLFGAKCTYVDSYGVSIPTFGTATTTAGASAPKVGFWEWLFGIHTSGAGNAANTAPTGFFGMLFAVVGGIFGFLWALFSALAYTASFLLFILILGSWIGLFLVRERERLMYGNLPPAAEKTHPLRARWQTLLGQVMSSNPTEWKEGILGADIMLGELLASLGYEGATTAERIRKIPDGAFANLPSAWEAHRIKNFVFSPSSHFILTQREAFRAMKLYEQAFKEFDFI